MGDEELLRAELRSMVAARQAVGSLPGTLRCTQLGATCFEVQLKSGVVVVVSVWARPDDGGA